MNNYETNDVVTILRITKKRTGEAYDFIVDTHNLDRINKHKWRIQPGRHGKVYASTVIGGKWVSLHRFIMNAVKGEIVDHEDRNPQNNLESNLRRASWRLNNLNADSRRSRQRGVYPRKRKKGIRWEVTFKINGVMESFGYYDTEEEASNVASNIWNSLYAFEAKKSRDL